MKITKRALPIIMALLMLMSLGEALAIDDGFYSVYTYNYDYWEEIRESPNAYKVQTVLYGSTLGLEKNFNQPQGMFIRNNDIYVCDTNNNRIVHIVKQDDGTFVMGTDGDKGDGIFETVIGGSATGFLSPRDCFVDEDYNIYISDYNNHRVVMFNPDREVIKEFVRPDDSSFDLDNFNPLKICVDAAGRVYVLAENVNKGLIKFEANTEFAGYIGANKVSMTMFEYIWKYYFLSDEQRETTENTVPTRYENIYMDEYGFIYATTTNFEEYDLKWDNAKPIRRLNGIGDDILIKDDRYPPIGDYTWVEGSNDDTHGPSKLVDITVLENDIYVAIDKTRGRIFGYDSQGVMLWAFGAIGQYEGAFNAPVAIDHIGRELYCLDQRDNSITVFTPTEYGNLIFDAINAYSNGDYDGSAVLWESVLKYNANYNMAYRGIGRALLRKDQYSEAMDYFEMAHDRTNYGRAFRLYRKEWVERNIYWIVGALLVLIVVYLALRVKKNMKLEVAAYERDHVAK